MIDKAALIKDIAGKAGQILGGEKSKTREDVEHNVRALVGSALSKFELVTREEFDAQAAVLQHTRERLEALEKKVAAMEETQVEAD